MSFIDKDRKEVYLKKKWVIATNHPKLQEELKMLPEIPEYLTEEQFIECKGGVAKHSARYTEKLAKSHPGKGSARIVWSS